MLSVKYALKLECDVKCAMRFWTLCHFHWYIQYQVLFKVILSAFFLLISCVLCHWVPLRSDWGFIILPQYFWLILSSIQRKTTYSSKRIQWDIVRRSLWRHFFCGHTQRWGINISAFRPGLDDAPYVQTFFFPTMLEPFALLTFTSNPQPSAVLRRMY